MKRKVALILVLMLALFALTACSASKAEQTVDTATNSAAVKVVDDPKYEVGQYITFGTYPQTAAGDDNTPIEWLVLAKEGDRALLVSRYGLDCQRYNNKQVDITWEQCGLRTWLNEDFLNKAFSKEEQTCILTANVTVEGNSYYSTHLGNDTQDKVFQLSVDELKKYFKNNESLRCAPTAYAVKQGVYKESNGYSWWWLRDLGINQEFALRVTTEGAIYMDGVVVSYGGIAVRPALWVKVAAGVDSASELPPELAKDDGGSKVTPEPAKEVAVGDCVTIGSYPQTQNGTDSTPIEWKVLAKEGNKALLISRYALDCQPYHYRNVDVTWEESSMRTWLNRDFIYMAFSEEEEACILTTNITAGKNPSYSTDPGKDTQDKLFLLSIDEVEKYFKNDKLRQCQPTAYAVKRRNALPWSDTCAWWLRTPGNSLKGATLVFDNGKINRYGYCVDDECFAVRPAMWVDLGSGIFNQ